MAEANRYSQIIEELFHFRFKPGAMEVPFERDDLVRVAKRLGIRLPKNLGDVIYSFRYRTTLPESVRAKAPARERMDHPASRTGEVLFCRDCEGYHPTK
jgi:hypothetical protein